MALRRRLAAVADMFLRNHLAQRLQENQSSLIQARQQELAQQQMAQKILEQALSNPGFGSRLLGAGITNIGGMPVRTALPSPAENIATIGKPIADAKSLSDLRTPEDMDIAYHGLAGVGPHQEGDLPPELIQALKARQAMLTAEEPPTPVTSVNPAGNAMQTRYVPKGELPGLTVQTSFTPEQQGANQSLVETLTAPARAAAAGMEAGARAKAELPYQINIAQVRANAQLLNQQAMDDYKRKHPHATAMELNRERAAQTALGMISENRAMLAELDKQGILGPLMGRAADFAAGKIKSEDLFRSPGQAKLASDYFSSMRLLRSLATVAHGGSKGGGSPQMDHIFEAIISGFGDRSNTEGQLDALERLMKKYSDDPASPVEADTNIPGMPGVSGNPTSGPTKAQSKLQQLRSK